MMSDISISYFNEEIANEVRAAFNGTAVYCKQSLEYKGSLKSHRERLGKSNCIVLVICDDYLKSSECLSELLEVYKNDAFRARIFPIVLNNVEIQNPHYHLNCIKQLEDERNNIEKTTRDLGELSYLKEIFKYLDEYGDWRRDLPQILDILKDINALNIHKLRENSYQPIRNAVSERLEKIKKTKEETPESDKKIPLEKIYLCNRKDQFNTFLNELQGQKKINTFYIHGDEMHGHDEMFERLCNHLRGSYRTNERNRKEIKTFNIDFSTISPTNFRLILLSKFLDALGMNLHQYSPSNPMIGEQLYNICQKSNYIKPLKTNDSIAINFRIPGGEWFPGLTDDIEWFVNDFCNKQSLPDDAPVFHFFFSVVYSRANLMTQPLRFRKLKQHKESIVKALKNTLIPDINELTWVKPDDVRDWLSVIGIQNPNKRQQLMSTKFKKDSRQGYYMSKLKSTLTDVINDHTNNKL